MTYPIAIGGGPAGEKGAAQAAYFGKKAALVEGVHSPTAGGARVLRRACDALASAIDRMLTAAFFLAALMLAGSLVATAAGLLLPSPPRDGFGEQNVAVADVLVTATHAAPLLADNVGSTRTIALLDSPDNPALDIGAFELVREAPITIADVIELFDQAVDAGTLMGVGPDGSARAG